MSKRRVVVTGLGLISPIGNDVATGWKNLLAGQSGVTRITRFDASDLACQVAAEVKGFDVSQYMTAKDARRMDLFMHYGIAAGLQAVADAGLDAAGYDPTRIGVNIGSGIGGLGLIEDTDGVLRDQGPRKVTPFFIPGSIINMVAGHLSIMKGFKGPSYGIVSACTTGAHCIGDAARIIAYGDADVMVAGGAESAITRLGIAGFAAARALSTRNDDPATASRPWDAGRDGFVMGEGAGVLVLEEYEQAKRRGATIYAELVGFGMSSDAHHMTAPCEDGEGAARGMENALRDARLNPDQIDYVNAHGTSTPLGDTAETIAIKRCFGDHAKRLAVNSTKSMVGHLLGGAGGVEAVYSALAIHHQVSPPTINLHEPDPTCDLDYVANEARSMKIDVAISNSFGFGGTNGTLVFRRI
ncbi:beta-ketoacyl-ACP synthase II [Parachitinimonas caeni]|uniref:3-oxoacyl-[acyl-carrier-protein] synthase 2 n=1 Tax=Parachitinimonas caeni TaxID=3031301 RepID=A0ABT7DVG2_9NEIS|nr:beta-ketoacyl-ACP synthase II [Parachitinimonas caeni]MDK2123819.1 beta-ketoacyl-ACP synthase II [Parachitinimonas caeni]